MDLDVVVKIYARLPPGGGVVKGGGFGKVLQGKGYAPVEVQPFILSVIDEGFCAVVEVVE